LVVSYDIVGSVTQAMPKVSECSYKGEQVQVTRTGGSAREMCTITTTTTAGPSQVFVKRIIASDYIITRRIGPIYDAL
jgi:hypothetical protein